MKLVVLTGDLEYALHNVKQIMPCTAQVPFWTIWYRDKPECDYLMSHAVDRITMVEEEGDSISDNTEHSDAQSVPQISKQTDYLKSAQPAVSTSETD